MFGTGSYETAGYDRSDDGMGDTSFLDYALNLAAGLVPGVGTPLPAVAPIQLSGGNPAQVLTDAVSGGTATVTAPSGVKLRSAPNEVTGAVIGAGLPSKTVVTVLAKDFPPTPVAPKGWTKVRAPDGREGYVTTEWLSISSPTSASSGGGGSSLALSSSSPLPNVKPPADTYQEPSFFENKLVWIGGGVVALAIAGALLFGGKKGRK